jgi:hypothetical protein
MTKGRKKRKIALKNMSWGQLKKIKPKMKSFADSDKDGFPNFMDCRPLNNKKHYVSERDPFYWAYKEVFANLRWGK